MPTILSDESYQRLRPTIEGASNDAPNHVDIPRTNNWQLITVTGPASASTDATKTYYPGTVGLWDADDEGLTAKDDVWITDANEGTLEEDYIYIAVQSGRLSLDEDERPVFVTGAAGGAGGTFDITCDGDTVTVTRA